jgi:hypothetical protein
MVEISSALITTMTGMLGVIVGAVISNYLNQKIARQSAKKDVIFRKRIDYFENIVKCIDKNTQMYYKSIKDLETNPKSENVNKILVSLKKNRKKFEIMTSPLYIDTRPISRMIKKFVGIEKNIFKYFKNSGKIDNDEIMKGLKDNFRELKLTGTRIITQLRENLLKE